MLRLVGRPEAWAEMAGAARRRVEEEFDVVRQAERLARLYVNAASERRRVCAKGA